MKINAIKNLKNLVIIDPDLKSKNLGHFYNYDLSVYRAFKNQNYGVEIYCSQRMLSEADVANFIFPVIKSNNGKGFLNKLVGLIQNQISLTYLIFSHFRRESSGVIFFPNFDIPLFFPVLFASVFLRGDKKIFFFYRYSISSKFANLLKFNLFYRVIFKIKSNRFLWVTDSELLKIEAKKYFDKDINLVPIPHVPNSDYFFNQESKSVPIFYIPGRLLPGKSFDKLIRFFNTSNFKLKIQADINELEIEYHKDFNLILEAINQEKIVLLPKFLNQEVLITEINNSEVILLPYKSAAYEKQTSGFFAEALGMGKIVIVGKNTWMSHILESTDASGISIDLDDFQFSKLAIDEVLLDYDKYNSRAKDFSREWCSYHNEETFYKHIMRTC